MDNIIRKTMDIPPLNAAKLDFASKYKDVDGLLGVTSRGNRIIALVDEDYPQAADDIPFKFNDYLVRVDYIDANEVREVFREHDRIEKEADLALKAKEAGEFALKKEQQHWQQNVIKDLKKAKGVE